MLTSLFCELRFRGAAAIQMIVDLSTSLFQAIVGCDNILADRPQQQFSLSDLVLKPMQLIPQSAELALTGQQC